MKIPAHPPSAARRRAIPVLGLLVLALGVAALVLHRGPEVRAADEGAGDGQAHVMVKEGADEEPAPRKYAIDKFIDLEDAELVDVPDLVRENYFRVSAGAIQGKTFRGQTILNAPAFKTVSRKESLELYPCSDCHEGEPANPKQRQLEDEHTDIVLEHGGGRYWCLTCHGSKDKDTLVSLEKVPINFDQPYLLCGQCHFQRQKDWFFGGHGKRIGTWNGLRVIKVCTECHNPHSPSIKPYVPAPPPKVRSGLARMHPAQLEPHSPWEKIQLKREKK